MTADPEVLRILKPKDNGMPLVTMIGQGGNIQIGDNKFTITEHGRRAIDIIYEIHDDEIFVDLPKSENGLKVFVFGEQKELMINTGKSIPMDRITGITNEAGFTFLEEQMGSQKDDNISYGELQLRLQNILRAAYNQKDYIFFILLNSAYHSPHFL